MILLQTVTQAQIDRMNDGFMGESARLDCGTAWALLVAHYKGRVHLNEVARRRVCHRCVPICGPSDADVDANAEREAGRA